MLINHLAHLIGHLLRNLERGFIVARRLFHTKPARPKLAREGSTQKARHSAGFLTSEPLSRSLFT